MSDARQLLPPVRVINEQLSSNERERRVLRTLLKLALRNSVDPNPSSPCEPRPEANGQAVAP